jgi:hypothetical protein
MKEEVLFKETQRFTQWWLWLIIILLCAMPLGLLFNDLTWSVPNVITSIVALVILTLFLSLKMTTTITDKEIVVRYFPLITKKWFWADLETAEVLDYGFVGGWGIRFWTDYGTVYNVKGSKGIHIKAVGKEYLVGTQKEEELRSSIAHLLK